MKKQGPQLRGSQWTPAVRLICLFLWQQCVSALHLFSWDSPWTSQVYWVQYARGEVKCSNMHFAIVAIPEDKNSNKQYRLFTIEHLMLQLLHTKANAQTWFQVSNPRTCLDSWNVICDLHRNSGSNIQLFQWLGTHIHAHCTEQHHSRCRILPHTSYKWNNSWLQMAEHLVKLMLMLRLSECSNIFLCNTQCVLKFSAFKH